MAPAPTRQRWTRWAIAALIGATIAACQHTSSVKRVLPGRPTGQFAELSESDLSAIVVCNDTLGRTERVRKTESPRCAPCVPMGSYQSAERSLAHARRLWLQGARAPYDTLDEGANCAQLSYRYALEQRPTDDSLLVEYTLFRLADERDSVRAAALRALDDRLGERLNANLRPVASEMLAQLASGIWDRAQRQLERPFDLDYSRSEQRVHDLAANAPALAHIPRIPPTAAGLGESEAEWASRLFIRAAQLTASSPERSRLLRLGLAPWVVLENWRVLDSVGRALLRLSPTDSVIRPAIALAAYYRIRRPVAESPGVMLLFDSALRAMPRVDSLRYDTFDGMLTQQDDDWRYGFLPSDRELLDTRGWTVLDPLWSTPVNEIRLAKRARIAEADYRYADIARAGQAGSETRAGEMLVRLGTPSPAWQVADHPYAGRRWIARGWRTMNVTSELDDGPETYRVFYGAGFSIDRAALFQSTGESGCSLPKTEIPTFYNCAQYRRADWIGVPFYATTDTIDVTVARFRAAGDSADVYIGARVPLRGFKPEIALDAEKSDRITISAWLTTAFGAPVFHATVADALPDPNAIATLKQWSGRVGSLNLMHRVEALEPTRPNGARGAAQFTSESQIAFPLRGFGISDVLIAASARIRTNAKSSPRWSDLDVRPNGGVIAPGQTFAMAWEVYGLAPGPDGRVRWRVQLRRERGDVVTHDDMKAVLTFSRSAGTKVLPNESDAPDVSYARDALASPVVLDNLKFGLSDASPGRHVVRVKIDDLVSGRSVSRSVSVRVLPTDAQKRGTLQFAPPPRANR